MAGCALGPPYLFADAQEPAEIRPSGEIGPSGRGAIALACVGLTKVFPVMDAGSVWKLVVRSAQGRQVTAVEGVSLAVAKGTIIGILGRNGAGKSTLLRLLAGVYTPTAGRIWSDGTIAGVFELGGAGSRFQTGREYARRALTLQGLGRREINGRVAEIREFAELGAAFDDPIYTYSTGMKARLYFAAATALDHDVYLIDEMLAVGDEHFRAKCWKRIQDRLSAGASGILVTHDWSAALRLCQVGHIMERGQIVESGPIEKVVRTYVSLAQPRAEVAQFSASNPAQYTAESGRDTEFVFGVELLKPVPIALAYSIEALRPGLGWEILLIADNLPLADTPGQYDVRLAIPRLPLPGGHYYLNLFLASRRIPGRSARAQTYDVRGWTYGNAIDLVVAGSAGQAATTLPIEWAPIVVSKSE